MRRGPLVPVFLLSAAVALSGSAADAPTAASARSIVLKAGRVAPGEPMPAASIAMPASGNLFIVQAKHAWNRGMRVALHADGCSLLSYVPQDAYLVRCAEAARANLARRGFVERIEPYHCSYRLDAELAAWLESDEGPEQQEVRVVAVEPAAAVSVADAANALSAFPGAAGGGGSVVDVLVDREQLRALACHDAVQWIDRWHPPESDMDLVRIDSGADWLEDVANGGYCGTGVRGEVVDSGVDKDHVEYGSRLELHGTVTDDGAHGTSCTGVVFAEGVDPQAKGHLPCATAIFGDNGESACFGCDRFAHTEVSKTVHNASFQSSSWGASVTTSYTSISYLLDEIIWRLDMALFQSQSNQGASATPQDSRPEAWAKNIFAIGGINHQSTADPSDDFWCDHDCPGLHGGDQASCVDDPACLWFFGCFNNYGCASVGPAEDGRQKPDLAYWYDRIYTTDTDNGTDTYTNFGGTSAATPEAAGTLGLILEMWADTSQGGVNPWGYAPAGTTVFDRQPHAATMKALMINSAEPYPFSGAGHDLGRESQGWGRPNVQNAKERAARSLVVDEEVALQAGGEMAWQLEVIGVEEELRATLSWLDPPKTLSTGGNELLNDLDLKLVSPPDGNGDVTVYCGNVGLDVGNASTSSWTGPGPQDQAPDCDDGAIVGRDDVNNVENVFVREAQPGQGVTTGSWRVEVDAVAVPVDGNPDPACRNIDLDPNDPELGRIECEAAGCQWDGAVGLCRDATFDVVFGLVVTGAAEGGGGPADPGASDGLTVANNGDGTLQLSWNADCGAGTSYGVYRGDLGSGYGSIAPEPGKCDVGGTTTSVPEGPGSGDFFLVVPNTGVHEGSYGNATGGPRAPAAAPCYAQAAIDACAP